MVICIRNALTKERTINLKSVMLYIFISIILFIILYYFSGFIATIILFISSFIVGAAIANSSNKGKGSFTFLEVLDTVQNMCYHTKLGIQKHKRELLKSIRNLVLLIFTYLISESVINSMFFKTYFLFNTGEITAVELTAFTNLSLELMIFSLITYYIMFVGYKIIKSQRKTTLKDTTDTLLLLETNNIDLELFPYSVRWSDRVLKSLDPIRKPV